MIDRLERFVVRITQPLDGLVFLFVLYNGMIGIVILSTFWGSRVLLFVGCGVGLLFHLLCAVILHRYNLRHRQKGAGAEEQPTDGPNRLQRMPLQFIGYGALCIAICGWGMLLAMIYPAVHPLRGEIRWVYGLLLAAASGSTTVGIAGFADPRICLAVHRSTRKLSLPIWARLVGWTLLLSGFAAGGYLAFLIAN